MATEPEGKPLYEVLAEEAELLDFEEFTRWHRDGVERGWVTTQVCATHDGVPYTETEAIEFEEGYDPCQFIMRVRLGHLGEMRGTR